ncbi:MAG: DUF3089 domain-containing protein [Acidimicrobiales bacterium]
MPAAGTRLVIAFVAVAGLAGAAVACSGDDDDADSTGADAADADAATDDVAEETELPEGYADYQSELYADQANWLCKPGLDEDVCSRDLDATAVFADGSTEVQPHEVAEDPAIDCFYVYPTVSFDESPNSDLEVAEGSEIFTAYNQAARLSGACRVFAPIYRQVTLSMIGGSEPPEGVDPRQIAYDDVVDAFRHYVANDSDSRGFVLVGHSQGAGHLNRLVAEEIDDEPLLRDRMVSALLLGSTVAVPEGEVVGGDFQNVPLCDSEDQIGCVVSYASFRSTAPPPDNSLFGRPRDGEGRAACVNPASPEGGSAALQPYFAVELPEGGLIGGVTGAQPFGDPARSAEITTPFVTYPDFVDAECVDDGEFSYLSLTVNGDPADPRADDIGGDLTPEWGMHLIDANVAMGDLLDLVRAQGEVYADG